MKKFWKYFIIVILMLLGLACVGLLYLFFFPNSSLFGISYISHAEELTTSAYETTSVTKIELTNNRYDIEVLESASDKISASVKAHSFGYCLTKNKNISLNANLKNGVLIITISEPTGLLLDSYSKVKLLLPKNFECDLEINNNKAPTKIDGEELIINNFTYITNSGDCSFKSGTLNGDLDLTLGKSTFTLSDDVSTNTPSVNLKMTSGKFNSNSHLIKDLVIENNNKGVVVAKSCNSLMGNLKSAGGRIDIESVGYIDFKSSDTNIYLTNLGSGFIELTESGKIEINNVTNLTEFITKNGNITLHNVELDLTIESSDGDITIYSAHKHINAKTTYGDIYVAFAGDANSYINDNLSRKLTATTENGKITATGIENATVKANDNGRIELDFKNVYGSNSVISNYGSTSIFVYEQASYYLTTASVSGNVKVNLSRINEMGGYTIKEETTNSVYNCTDTNINLIARTNSGDLTIIDGNY